MGRNVLFLTAAAALSTGRASAFIVQPRQPDALLPSTLSRNEQTGILSFHSHYRYDRTSIRLYHSKKKEDGFLKKAAKALLPKKWFQSEEEQKAELARKQVKDNVQGGIQEMLKDAPLPVRMMGRMISPILSNVASELSASMAEQQQTVEQVLQDARSYILGDDVAVQELGGEPIRVGAPFSQSSSTSIINGQKTTNIMLAFPVEGSRQSGTAQVQATDQGISKLILQVNNGRQIHVSLTRRRGGGSGSSSRIGRNHLDGDDDNIIEAEIIEKDVKK